MDEKKLSRIERRKGEALSFLSAYEKVGLFRNQAHLACMTKYLDKLFSGDEFDLKADEVTARRIKEAKENAARRVPEKASTIALPVAGCH